uniref:Ig-like domain-containing protein n=1 Tax=Crocodylus porosus TaxID=8502 RepID=A0A7M4FXT4_CROPO
MIPLKLDTGAQVNILPDHAISFLCCHSPLSFPDAHGEITITQTPEFTVKRENAAVRMSCVLQGISENIASAIIHWYHQSPGEAPKRANNLQVTIDPAKSHSSKHTCTFNINSATKTDTGVYYCAYWDNTFPLSQEPATETPLDT